MSRLALVLTLAILSVPLAAEAQQAGKVARVGFLSNVSAPAHLLAAFREGLRELGYVEGQHLLVE